MLRSLLDRPLVCFVIAFILGLILASYGLVLISAAASLAAGLALALIRRRTLMGILALSMAALAGGQLYLLDQGPRPNTVAVLREGAQTLVGTIASAPSYSFGEWRFLFAVESHEEGSASEPLGGICEVWLAGHKPVLGERWRLTGRLRLPGPPRNPGGRPQGASYTSLGASGAFLVDGELAHRLGPGRRSWLDRRLLATQRTISEALEAHVGAPYRELTAGVANSVIFGVHASPPPDEIASDFRQAGTMHLLVVSGSMVSLVFGMVFFPGVMSRRGGPLVVDAR